MVICLKRPTVRKNCPIDEEKLFKIRGCRLKSLKVSKNGNLNYLAIRGFFSTFLLNNPIVGVIVCFFD